MLDQWFKKDIQEVLDCKSVIVFTDESAQSRFLLKTLGEDVQLFECHDEVEELHVKYQIEQAGKQGKFLIYTNTPTDDLKYIREYCATEGELHIKYLQNYIKGKVHRHIGLNLNLAESEIISAGKISIGKDQTYWMDLCNKGATQIFDLEKDLVAFLANPVTFIDSYDANVKAVFYEKVHETIGQHKMDKPAQTLANELVEHIFQGLLHNNISSLLEKVYFNWLDSVTYSDSFRTYLSSFKVPKDIDIWKVHLSHPFETIDKLQLKEVADNINNKSALKGKKSKLIARSKNKIAKQIGVRYWTSILTLMNYKVNDLSSIDSLKRAVEVYMDSFYKVDRAMRLLYTDLLHEPDTLTPIQEYYEHHVLDIFLDKWFRYISDYQSNQTGTLSEIIKQNERKTAVVIGDGITYEYALLALEKVNKDFKRSKGSDEYMLAAYPSETENNMSQIYVATGEVMKVHKDREKYLLKEFPKKNIGFLQLEKVNESTDQFQYLICQFKDLDELGEKQQQRALKYFETMLDTLVSKIEQLLRNGYEKVYLISDHGFVLTGLLPESNKIHKQVSGTHHASERYIRSVEHPKEDGLITFPQNYGKYQYLSFAKSIAPFKTPGVYGYSHGGLTPQELIIPYFCWEREAVQPKLNIRISNKDDLSSVLGDIFSVQLQTESTSTNLFNTERKIQLLLFSEGKEFIKSDIITVQSNEQLKKEFQFDGKDELDLRIIDVNTKETIDLVKIKKDGGRDLGGLL